jgi:4-oxalocrotonate tautomerase
VRTRTLELTMPFVYLMITKDGVTRDQKSRLVADITQSLVRVLGKKPEHTHVVIEEVETENWGFAGELTTDYRARQQREQSPKARRAPRARST